MFAHQVVYPKHGCEEGAAGRNLVLRTIEKTIGGDVRVITAGVQCAMFVKTYGKKITQIFFWGSYEGGSGASLFDKKNSVNTVTTAIQEYRHLLTRKLESMLNILKSTTSDSE